MAAPTLVGITGNKGVFGSSIVFTTPTGTANGDWLLFALVMIDTYQTAVVSPPSGAYTLVTQTSTAQTAGMYVWKKQASSEPSTHTFTFTTSFIQHGTVSAYRGSNGVDVSSNNVDFTGGGTWVATGVTVSSANSKLVTHVWAQAPSTATGQTLEFSQDADFSSHVVDVYDETVSSGATGSRSGTVTGADVAVINVVLGPGSSGTVYSRAFGSISPFLD